MYYLYFRGIITENPTARMYGKACEITKYDRHIYIQKSSLTFLEELK